MKIRPTITDKKCNRNEIFLSTIVCLWYFQTFYDMIENRCGIVSFAGNELDWDIDKLKTRILEPFRAGKPMRKVPKFDYWASKRFMTVSYHPRFLYLQLIVLRIVLIILWLSRDVFYIINNFLVELWQHENMNINNNSWWTTKSQWCVLSWKWTD